MEEVKVLSVKYITEVDNFKDVIISIDWEYKSLTGTLELEEPSNKDFIELKEINEELVLEWLNQKIDFSRFIIEEVKNEEVEVKVLNFYEVKT